ncbi:MAG: MBL fold metallo-hydrolase [Armatimonadota bacterium]|nr:MAG: MBL fold metallo-hydrolase [Armatimonadota bacterium]
MTARIRHLRPERLILAVLILAVVVAWVSVYRAARHTLVVTFFDVGQGDSALIQAPSGRTLLIDGGGRGSDHSGRSDVGERVIVPGMMVRGVTRLDGIIVTHGDDDHVNGLDYVVDQVPVQMILDPLLPHSAPPYERLRAFADENGVPIVKARLGQRFNLGHGITAAVLHPGLVPIWDGAADLNDNSVIVRLVCGDVSFLFAGDVEAAGQRQLLARDLTLHSTVLKVPHHGADAETTVDFVRAVRPELAVLSVGADNPYGHPSPAVVERLRAAGAKVMRTDIAGAITVTTDGRTWEATAYRRY